jgi:hypothetical protein
MTNQPAASQPTGSLDIPSLMRRYRDGYRVASTVITLGGLLKAIGVILGVLATIGGFIYAQQSFMGMPIFFQMGGFVIGALAWFVLYVVGVIISSHGQVLRASLDEAVWVCPFLTNDQRAKSAALQRI